MAPRPLLQRVRYTAPVRTTSVALAATLLAIGAAGSPSTRSESADPTGRRAPVLALPWATVAPHEMADLRGRVVLVRWWTDTCPFCATSAPALVDWHERYADRGLVVLGVFHPKPRGDASLERARRGAARLGFDFPIAVDADWAALRRWWLDTNPTGWTSVTFVVDRRGVIRHVHPGGEYHRSAGGGSHRDDHDRCRRDWEVLDALLGRLLDEAP